MALSLRRALKLSAIFSLCLAASLSTKLAIGQRGAADTPRLGRDVLRHLEVQGFAVTAKTDEVWTIEARRGDCRLLVANGDYAGALGTQLRIEASPDLVLIGYREKWAPAPADVRSVIERLLQEYAYSVGISAGRPSVLAFASAASCPVPGEILDGLQTWPTDGP